MDNVVEILWASLRALDASSDLRKEKPVVLALKHDMLRVIAELETARLQRAAAGQPAAAGPVLVSGSPARKDGAPRSRHRARQAEATVLRMRSRKTSRH